MYDAGPHGLPVFLLITAVLGGAAAFVSGRATAVTWRPRWQLVVYATLLAAVTRFFQFALFGATLLSPSSFAIDCLFLLAAAALGYRLTRVRQMVTQYPWLYRTAGPLGWRRRPDGQHTDAQIRQ